MGQRYSLDDKFLLDRGAVYMTGIQALVRLPIEQMRRDRALGLHTGTFISGYEGSPLGGYDLALLSAGKLLQQHNIHFVPGVNEDLAATAVMGSQLYQTLPGPKVDGVVGIWYGKGPGVDRTGDVFRHANLAGTGKNCGALALAGDDHISKSSTIPHQSELSFFNFGMPTLAAGNVQEVLDYGLYGIALSRYTGAWSALKLATDVCDGGGTVELSPERCRTIEPELVLDGKRFEKTSNGLLIAPMSLEIEQELLYRRLEAAKEFAWTNGLNRIVARGEHDRLGIVAPGKAYYDLRTALRHCGLDEAALERTGLRILKPALVYPLEPRIAEEFAAGLDEILVIEEKRSFVEFQLRELLFNRHPRPAVYGKTARDGRRLLPSHGELDAETITRVLAQWLRPHGIELPGVDRRVRELDEIRRRFEGPESTKLPPRIASYCSGCPHNRSTLLLEGQIAGGGIGCHGMAASLSEAHRGIAYLGQMGGEGAAWIGMAPFTSHRHLFQNLGDGTYFHSGKLAVSAAAAAGVNITYKILFNGAVAMTGGQEVAGGTSIPALTRELEAAGIRKIVLLTEDVQRYEDRSELAPAAEVRPREDLEDALRELEAVPGVSVMIYDQMCAAERRRRRNRGQLPQPVRRLVIHEQVCEGCGDCVAKSNCVSLRPVETEFGAKTRIHQSSCNMDYSCLLGDCPSFVSVYVDEGTGLKRRPLPELPPFSLPEPSGKPALDHPWRVLMPGIGGSGVVTVNALLATAALIEGRRAITLDQTGLAQKGGAVVSHLTVSAGPLAAANRVSYGAADLLLGFDVLGAASPSNLRRSSPERTVAVVNVDETPTGNAIRRGLTVMSPQQQYRHQIDRSTRREDNLYVNATEIAEALFGSHLQTNVFLLGVAYQAGLIPLKAETIEEVIELNGVAVKRNREAFRWGRRWITEPEAVIERLPREEQAPVRQQSLDELIEHRSQELARYQDKSYAARYRDFVTRVREAEQRTVPGRTALSEAAARNLYKLMAYKDEYEVARLLTSEEFEQRVRETFEAPRKLVYHLHPPLLRKLGVKRKLSLGPWARPLLKLLASFKTLRGTAFDPFGWMPSRREERELIAWYQENLQRLLSDLNAGKYATAVEFARLPESIRGYEQVKSRSIEAARKTAAALLTDSEQRSAA